MGSAKQRGNGQLVRGCTLAALRLLSALANAYRTLPSFTVLFGAVSAQLSSLRKAFEHDAETLRKIDCVANDCEHEPRETPLEALQFDRERLKMLRQFEPRISTKFGGDAVQSEREKRTKVTRTHKTLLRKMKREEKGAIRELRRDAGVLRRVAVEDQLHKDAERKRKVKRILGDLGQQEGDFRALKRGKTDESEEKAE